MKNKHRSSNPVDSIMRARNEVLTATSFLEEFCQDISSSNDIVLNLKDSIECMNIIQGWFMRHEEVILKDIFYDEQY